MDFSAAQICRRRSQSTPAVDRKAATMKVAAALAALPAVSGFGYVSTAASTCTLAAPSTDDAPGSLNWVQTGPVMRLYTTKSYPREIILSGNSAEVDVGNMYTPLCLTQNYMADKGCVVQCTEAGLDYETYCSGLDINDICKPYQLTNMNVACGLDFDTDEDVYGIGASMKDIWAQIYEVWNSEAGLEALFETGADMYGNYRAVFFPHNFANLINMGLGVNVGASSAGSGNFSYFAINLAAYTTDTEDYEFGEDPTGSTADGPVFFKDHWKSEGFIYALNDTGYDAVSGSIIYAPTIYDASDITLKATYLSTIGIDYDPCDADGDAKFMGLPKSCFHIHQGGPHMENGQMWPFYKPMKDGTMDFFGVCPIDKYEPQSNALLAHTYSPENADAFGEASAAAGGLALAHGRTWGLHFCIPVDDPTHPYSCTIGSAPQEFYGNGELSDFMILDPLSFVSNPVWDGDDMCAKYTAGYCDLYNEAEEVTGTTSYEYPVDYVGETYMPWSPY